MFHWIVTFSYVGLKIECSELIHALFGLWGFWRLQLRLLFLDKTRTCMYEDHHSFTVKVTGLLEVRPERTQLTDGSSWSVFSIQVSSDCRSLGPWYLIASSSGLNNFNLEITHFFSLKEMEHGRVMIQG